MNTTVMYTTVINFCLHNGIQCLSHGYAYLSNHGMRNHDVYIGYHDEHIGLPIVKL